MNYWWITDLEEAIISYENPSINRLDHPLCAFYSDDLPCAVMDFLQTESDNEVTKKDLLRYLKGGFGKEHGTMLTEMIWEDSGH